MKTTEMPARLLQIYESSSGLRLANFRQHALKLPANSIFLTWGTPNSGPAFQPPIRAVSFGQAASVLRTSRMRNRQQKALNLFPWHHQDLCRFKIIRFSVAINGRVCSVPYRRISASVCGHLLQLELLRTLADSGSRPVRQPHSLASSGGFALQGRLECGCAGSIPQWLPTK
jgi:hypothetical protein